MQSKIFRIASLPFFVFAIFGQDSETIFRSRYAYRCIARIRRDTSPIWSMVLSQRCVLYRKTLSEIYGEIMRDGVSESDRPLFSAPSIMLISIAARLMEEGGVSAPYSAFSPSSSLSPSLCLPLFLSRAVGGSVTFFPHSAERA